MSVKGYDDAQAELDRREPPEPKALHCKCCECIIRDGEHYFDFQGQILCDECADFYYGEIA